MEEGPRALFYGVTAGMQRQAIFIGFGNGLYVPIRNSMQARSGNESATILQKIVAGFVAGTIGVTLANPCEVVKVRL